MHCSVLKIGCFITIMSSKKLAFDEDLLATIEEKKARTSKRTNRQANRPAKIQKRISEDQPMEEDPDSDKKERNEDEFLIKEGLVPIQTDPKSTELTEPLEQPTLAEEQQEQEKVTNLFSLKKPKKVTNKRLEPPVRDHANKVQDLRALLAVRMANGSFISGFFPPEDFLELLTEAYMSMRTAICGDHFKQFCLEYHDVINVFHEQYRQVKGDAVDALTEEVLKINEIAHEMNFHPKTPRNDSRIEEAADSAESTEKEEVQNEKPGRETDMVPRFDLVKAEAAYEKAKSECFALKQQAKEATSGAAALKHRNKLLVENIDKWEARYNAMQDKYTVLEDAYNLADKHNNDLKNKLALAHERSTEEVTTKSEPTSDAEEAEDENRCQQLTDKQKKRCIELIEEMGNDLDKKLKNKDISSKEHDEWAGLTRKATSWAQLKSNMIKTMKQLEIQTESQRKISATAPQSPRRVEVTSFGDKFWHDNVEIMTNPYAEKKVAFRDYIRTHEGMPLYQLLTTFQQPTKEAQHTWTNWWLTITQNEVQRIKGWSRLFLSTYDALWADALLINPTSKTTEGYTLRINSLINMANEMKMRFAWVEQFRQVKNVIGKSKTVGQLKRHFDKLKPWAFKPDRQHDLSHKMLEINFNENQLKAMDKEVPVHCLTESDVVVRHCPIGFVNEEFFELFDADKTSQSNLSLLKEKEPVAKPAKHQPHFKTEPTTSQELQMQSTPNRIPKKEYKGRYNSIAHEMLAQLDK